MIGIINYNMGNLASVYNACNKLDSKAKIITKPEELKEFDKIILPGVGAYGDAMSHLREYNLDEAIKEYANSGKYLLGICLGMQLLFDSSSEFGDNQGLGLINGKVKKFDKTKMNTLKIPHMGWNEVFIKDSPIFKDLPKEFYLYFVHSYHINTDDKNVIGYSDYGYKFASIVNKDNIFGIQPHPEKSHNNGLKILENFINL
jgi:glutamine amidotransferase